MENRTAFRKVDGLAGEHCLALLCDASFCRQPLEQIHDPVVDRCLGEIHQQVPRGDAVPLETLRVGSECRPKVGRIRGGSGGLQLVDDGLHGMSS